MLQVCPSISTRSVGVLAQRRHRFVEHARRFRPQRVAVEVEVHVLERVVPHRRPRHLDVDRVGRRLVVGRARDGDRHRHRAFLLRRRPQRLPFGRLRQRAGRRRPPIGHRAADRALRGRRHRGALARLPPCTDCTRALTVRVCAGARRRRRRWRRRRRRRRHVDAHARVIADPDLQVVVVAEDVFAVLGERSVPRPSSARSSSRRRRRRSPSGAAHVSAERWRA